MTGKALFPVIGPFVSNSHLINSPAGKSPRSLKSLSRELPAKRESERGPSTYGSLILTSRENPDDARELECSERFLYESCEGESFNEWGSTTVVIWTVIWLRDAKCETASWLPPPKDFSMRLFALTKRGSGRTNLAESILPLFLILSEAFAWILSSQSFPDSRVSCRLDKWEVDGRDRRGRFATWHSQVSGK